MHALCIVRRGEEIHRYALAIAAEPCQELLQLFVDLPVLEVLCAGLPAFEIAGQQSLSLTRSSSASGRDCCCTFSGNLHQERGAEELRGDVEDVAMDPCGWRGVRPCEGDGLSHVGDDDPIHQITISVDQDAAGPVD